jgi:hypothetical protein
MDGGGIRPVERHRMVGVVGVGNVNSGRRGRPPLDSAVVGVV